MVRSPKKVVRILLLLLISSVSFLNYWEYSKSYQKIPDAFEDVVRGTAVAPQQYRVLVIRSAWFLHQHAHLGLRHAFALFDFVAALVCGFIMLRLLENSEVFRNAKALEQSFCYAVFLFLNAYTLIWLDWFQKPETMPTAFFVAFMLATLSWKPKSKSSLALIAFCTLLLSGLQAMSRADVSFCFYSGVFLLACLPAGKHLPVSGAFQRVLSASAALLAGAVAWFIIRRVYPYATYGDTAVNQFRGNFGILQLFPFLLFMLPSIWTVTSAWRNRNTVEAPWLAPVLAACLFVPLWMVVGRLNEVRIFLPFALAFTPLTSICALLVLRGAAKDAPAV